MPQEQRKQGDEQVQLLWGGRFKKPLAEEALKFSSSFSVDKRLWKQDILGSIAHAIMLGKTGIVGASEAEALVKGLVALMRDIESGKVALEGLDEDIHSFVERKLREYVGKLLASCIRLGAETTKSQRIFAFGAATPLSSWLKGF